MDSYIAPSGSGENVANRLPVDLPSTISAELLVNVLGSTDGSTDITEDRIRAPDQALLLHIYRSLLSIPSLKEAISLHEQEKNERERRDVDMETQLHEAERLRSEAESRSEADRQAKESSLREKLDIEGQLVQTQSTLNALQSNTETSGQQAAEWKGRWDQAEQEKRGILEMLEREKVESARRSEDIENLTARSHEARVEINRLSKAFQEAKSAEGTAKFRIQSLEQELLLKTNDATWAHTELSKTTQEFGTHRIKAHSEVTSLTSRLQQVSQDLEAAQTKIGSLQTAYDSSVAKVEGLTREKSELRQRIVEQEGAFKSEMATQQRLSSLVEQQKDNAEKRLADIESQWEDILTQHREKESVLREEIGDEQSRSQVLLREKEELKQALDRLAESVGIETTHEHHTAIEQTIDESGIPATPQRKSTSIAGTPSVMSPAAALASRVQKSGKSFTQVYADLVRTEEELRREKLESSRLGNVLEQVMSDLQERAPALQAQREETQRLAKDLEEISATLATVCEERDYAEREGKQHRLEAEASRRENTLLNQQVSDLARQNRELNREIILRDNPSADVESDGTHLGDPTAASVASVTDTQTIISTELVTYRSLTELITQNARLLRVVRELGAKLEAEENQYRLDLEEQESEAVGEAKQIIQRLQDEIRTERSRSESIRRERDMFRSMTAQGRGNLSSPHTEPSTAHVTLTNQYSQLQAQFEAFRTETANDIERLKEEAYQARSEASKNALDAARERATRESIEERLDNSQKTFEMERKELQGLQARYNALQESLTRQEITSQNFSQELLIAHNNVERLRNEVSNLSAERQLHKETTERLLAEKDGSVQERANLSEMLRTSQGMQADLERSSAEVRKRLESQVEKLEEQIKQLRERSTKEEDAHRQTSLRRDVELTDVRNRLDRATEEFSKIREEYAVAKTNVQHLASQNDELQKQVNSKDEKLAVYERKTTHSTSSSTSATTELDREQQLQVELADLKGELRGAQVEVEQAKGHVDQFKSIAAANEEALAQLQSTYDEYKASTDAALAQRDSELAALRERTTVIANELASTQKEVGDERQEREKEATTLRAEKKTLEDALAELTAVEDRARQAQQSIHDEVKKQMQLTYEAQGRYEAELLAHAEDVKALTSVKEQLDGLRMQALEAQKARETAEGNLASSQDSWSIQRSILEKEKDEQKRIVQELRGQNDALHKHLESLEAQANEIRRTAVGEGNLGDTSISSQSGSDELQEVIRYLRREKEIVDLQVELREQECARLRQSLEHTQRSLDEARLQLSQEREQNSGAASSAKQHEELMEKINQLSILRESNTTLRDESERAQRKVATLETRLESLTKELDPLRDDVRVKTVELEACQKQLALSQEDNKRWQGRTQSILQQYNRIDPDELKTLKEQKEVADKALEEQKATHEKLVEDLEGARAEVQAKQGQFDRLRQQSIDRIRALNQTIQEHKNEIEQLKTLQKEQQESQDGASEGNQATIAALQTEIENLKDEKQQLEARAVDLDKNLSELQQKLEDSSQTPAEAQGDGTASDEAIRSAVEEARKSWETERGELEEKRQTAERREQLHLKRAKEFNTMMRTAQRERDEALKEKEEGVTQLRQEWDTNHAAEIDKAVNERIASQGNEAVGSTNKADVEALQQRIAQLEEEYQRAQERVKELEEASITQDASAGGSTEGEAALSKRHEIELKELEARLSIQFMERQKQAVEVAVSKAQAAGAASDNVEEEVQKRLKQFEDGRSLEMQSAVTAKEQELKDHYEQQLRARYEAGKEEATLRNKLLLKGRDNRIEKLNAEINTLKGITPTPASSGTESNAPAGVAVQSAVRGGLPVRPVGRPTPAPVTQATTSRGGAPTRGVGRGGSQAAAGAQKRKIDQQAAGEAKNSNTEGQTASSANAGNVAKKPRPAGSPISIRGGGAGRGGGGAGRGGRGGASSAS